MTALWQHPQLGSFVFEDGEWKRILNLPAFDAFAYTADSRLTTAPNGDYSLVFPVDGGEQIHPLDSAVALATTLVNHSERLARAIALAIWNDFRGQGPDSGMWWHDNIVEVNESIDCAMSDTNSTLPFPQNATDIQALMRLFEIRIGSSAYEYDYPLIMFRFYAAFEMEHDVAVLSDAQSILGIGGDLDVTLFLS
ncbi:MAG: hypothetical protein AAGD25_07025 [Cyanobacteria bacterium P01_F01_bin.150]